MSQTSGLLKRLTALAIGGGCVDCSTNSSASIVKEAVKGTCASSGITSVENQTVFLQAPGQADCLAVVYSAYSSAGLDADACSKDNQDAWVIHEGLGGQNNLMLGVFDGHGQEGDKVSRQVAATLPGLMANSSAFRAKRFKQCCEEQFLACNTNLRKLKTMNCMLSGSTGVIALLQAGSKLLVANIGDSRCMLGRISKAGALTSVALSVDHVPDVPSEAARVRGQGGRLEPYTIGGEKMGPVRVWLADKDTPGLSMTRAFGDVVASSVGVIAHPDVVEVSLEQEDQYLVLCSDGIYEFMSNDEIIGIVHTEAEKGALPADIAKLLVRTARQQWMQEEDGGVDDCTAIVCFLTRSNVKPGALTPSPLPPSPKAGPISRPSISRRMSGTPVLLEEPQQISVAANAQTGSMPAAPHSPKRAPNHARGTIVQLPKAAATAASSRKHLAEGGLLAAITQVQGALDRESDASRRSTRSSRRSSDLPGVPGRTVSRSSDPSSS